MTHLKIALFTKVLGERSLTEAAEIAAELGYDAIEIMCREPHLDANTDLETARSLRSTFDDLGIEVSGLATYTGFYGDREEDGTTQLETFTRFVELSTELDCDLLRHNVGGPPEFQATEDNYQNAITWMRRASDLAADHDRRIALEIHADTIVESSETAATFVERIDRNNLGVIHDAGNMFISGNDCGYESVTALVSTSSTFT